MRKLFKKYVISHSLTDHGNKYERINDMKSTFFETINNKQVFCILTEPEPSQKKMVIMSHGFRGSSIGPARSFVVFTWVVSKWLFIMKMIIKNMLPAWVAVGNLIKKTGIHPAVVSAPPVKPWLATPLRICMGSRREATSALSLE